MLCICSWVGRHLVKTMMLLLSWGWTVWLIVMTLFFLDYFCFFVSDIAQTSINARTHLLCCIKRAFFTSLGQLFGSIVPLFCTSILGHPNFSINGVKAHMVGSNGRCGRLVQGFVIVVIPRLRKKGCWGLHTTFKTRFAASIQARWVILVFPIFIISSLASFSSRSISFCTSNPSSL